MLAILHCCHDRAEAEILLRLLASHAPPLICRLLPEGGDVPTTATLPPFLQALQHARFLIPLLSPSLLHAPWMEWEDTILALKKFTGPRPRMQPVQISACLWRFHPVFRSLSPLPWNAAFCRVPVCDPSWPSHEEAWNHVLRGLLDHVRPGPRTPFSDPETVLVPAGEFLMGCEDLARERPVRRVRLKAFHLGKYPVTVGQFSQFVESTGFATLADRWDCSFTLLENRPHPDRGVNWRCNAHGFAYAADEMNYPVLHISWHDAQAYCDWLSQKTGQLWRLPTEAEWEYAARGGDGSPDANLPYSGSTNLDNAGWHLDNSEGQTHPVGSKKPNRLGLYDMSGHVWEWCQDCWRDAYAEAPCDGSAFEENGCERRVLRGGSWRSGAAACRVTSRFSEHPTTRSDEISFRVVREV